MTLIKYKPDHKKETAGVFDNLFDKFFYDAFEDSSVRRFIPDTDVLESEKNYEILLAVPGMKKDAFSIDVEEGKLHIKGERKSEIDEKVTVHQRGIGYGAFERIFHLPDNVDQNNIAAAYEDGILKVRLPKDEKKIQKYKITVK